MDGAEGDLWRFALAVYGTDGVAEECLSLQERYGADIPVILCALWMARRGNALDPNGIERLIEVSGCWHAEVVKPLRAVRQRMKHGPSPAPRPRTETLRDAVKAVELSAERIELAVLADVVAAEFASGAGLDPTGNLHTALAYFAAGKLDADAPTDRLIQAALSAG
jgi:uncharacterized protein (TIGR02444 family)